MAGVGFGLGGTRALPVAAPHLPPPGGSRDRRALVWVEGRGGALLGLDHSGVVVKTIERPRHRQSLSTFRLLAEIVKSRPRPRGKRVMEVI